jgi:predicted GNAT family N-acyltransferase
VLTTAAKHERSGQLVAYTQLAQTLHQPEVAVQDDTLVHGDHRGHRLGLLVKATTLVSLAQHAPAVERIHTWNADQNAHMLAINAELGFRTAGAEGGWQRRPAQSVGDRRKGP